MSSLRAQATADGNTELTIKDIDVAVTYNGTGTCARFEISEDAGFSVGVTTNTEDCVSLRVPFTVSAGDGEKVIFARVRDTAGNASTPLTARINLDTVDPTLEGLSLVASAGADGAFSNERDVRMRLNGVSGGSRVLYRTRDGNRACPELDALTMNEELSVEFFISFDSDGPKTVCAAVVDDAGNTSEIQRSTITIDTLAPSAPALDPRNLSGINSGCVNITPSVDDQVGVIDTNFWKFEYRQLGATWSESPTAIGEPITIELQQDADNLLEVRAVDRAGNRGETNQVLIEEISSVFIPTNLQVKQICNGGQYAILKDLSVPSIAYTNKAAGESNVTFVEIPQVAILDLTTYQIRTLNPNISRDSITQEDCNREAFYQFVLDAACSGEPGEPDIGGLARCASGCVF